MLTANIICSMGGGHSTETRSIIVEESNGSGVVKVSEETAKRLLGGHSGSGGGGSKDGLLDKKGEFGEGGGSIEGVEEAEQKKVIEKKFRSSREWQAKLNEMELGYRKRIIELEKHNAELYQTTSEQLARAVEEVEEKFSIVKVKPVCKELEQRVFKCYLENPKHPLRCSKEVALFRECVKQQREKIFEKTRVTS